MLHSASDNSPYVFIKSSCEVIYGVSDQNYCFKFAKSTLEGVQFNVDSNLTSIGSYAFYNCERLREIDLRNCSKLTTIGKNAFQYCFSLSNVFLPNNIKKLLEYSFSFTAISSIRIPSSVQEIEWYSFAWISKLKNIAFEPGCLIKIIPTNLFVGSNLSSIVIPQNVNSVSGLAFQSNYFIQSIDIDPKNPNFVVDSNKVLYNPTKTVLYYFASGVTGTFTVPSTVTTIAFGSFCDSQLSVLNIPNSVTSIGDYSFLKSKINTFSLSDSITTIGRNCFKLISNLETIQLPSKITEIKTELFRSSGLKNIKIPENVISIGNYAFSGCPNLKEIKLNQKIKSIGGGVILNSPTAYFTFDNDSNLCIADNLLMDLDYTFISQYFGNNATVTIPSTVRTIKSNYFSYITSIVTVKCESQSDLEYIESNAFYGCTNLETFFNFYKIRSIGDYAFSGTKLKKDLVFGDNFNYIGQYAFSQTQITSVEFSSQIPLRIMGYAFVSCSSLHSVLFTMTSNVTLDNYVFMGCTSLLSIKIPREITSIGFGCFQNCGLQSVTFSSSAADSSRSLESSSNSQTIFTPSQIPDFMFDGCVSLSDFIIPSNVVSIGARSFQNTNLSIVSLPDSVTTLGYQCFKGCRLTELHINDESSLSSIDTGCFEGCIYFRLISEFISANFVGEFNALYNSDKTLIIFSPPASPTNFFSMPGTVRSISDYAFMGCSNLLTIVLPDNGVMSIGRGAFSGCSSLQMINIPICVNHVGEDAFLGCIKLSCGVIIQNKTLSFRHQLVASRLPSRALRDCDFKSCANNFHQINYAYICVMIIM